jgi:hypothetical protein
MDYLPIITTLWGLLVSFLEERYGKFQDLTPGQKQAVNAVLTFFLPIAISFAASYIDPKYANVNQQALVYVLLVLAPVVCYAASQAAHGVDKLLQAKANK